MIISNESMDFNDPKELNDPNYSMIPDIPRSQLFNDQLEVWTNPKVYCDTSIIDGLVLFHKMISPTPPP